MTNLQNDLVDFYMWMLDEEHEHNIKIRVEKKAQMYLNNVHKKCKFCMFSVKKDGGLWCNYDEVRHHFEVTDIAHIVCDFFHYKNK